MNNDSRTISRRAVHLAINALFCVGTALTPVLAATPKDTLVLAFAFDDIITMDPAEAFEISAGDAPPNGARVAATIALIDSRAAADASEI